MSESFYLSANIVTSTDSWGTVIERINQLVYDQGTINVTTSANSIGGFTSGNAYVQGIFSANTIAAAQSIRGGNVSTTNTLFVISDADFANGTTVTVGANLLSTNTATFSGSLVTISAPTLFVDGTQANVTSNVHFTGANIAIDHAAGDMTVTGNTTFDGAYTLDINNTDLLVQSNATFSGTNTDINSTTNQIAGGLLTISSTNTDITSSVLSYQNASGNLYISTSDVGVTANDITISANSTVDVFKLVANSTVANVTISGSQVDVLGVTTGETDIATYTVNTNIGTVDAATSYTIDGPQITISGAQANVTSTNFGISGAVTIGGILTASANVVHNGTRTTINGTDLIVAANGTFNGSLLGAGSLTHLSSANTYLSGTKTTVAGTDLQVNANTTWAATANTLLPNAAKIQFGDMSADSNTILLKVKSDGTGLEYKQLATTDLSDWSSSPPAGGEFVVWNAGNAEWTPTSTITSVTVTDSINVANTLSSNVAGQFVALNDANTSWAAGWTGSDSTDNWAIIGAANSTVSYVKLRAQTVEFNTIGTGVVSINKTGTGNVPDTSVDLHANGIIKTDNSLVSANVVTGRVDATANVTAPNFIGTLVGTANNATNFDGQPSSNYLRSNVNDQMDGQLTVANRLIVSGNTVQIDNNKAITAANTTGSQVELIKKDASNRTSVGESNFDVRLIGANVEFYNGSTAYHIWNESTFDPTSKADVSHTHVIADVTGLQANLNALQTNIDNQTVGGLSDVTISSVANDEIIVYQNGTWINQTLAESNIALADHVHSANDLSDVTISSPSAGELLVSNGTVFLNQTIGSNDLDDVVISSITAGELLVSNGTSFINQTLAEAGIANTTHSHNVNDLLDVTITSVANGELITYQNGTWINQTLAEAGIANSNHQSAISDVTGLQTALDSKFDGGDRIYINANHTATAEQRIGFDTSSNTATITAPSSPANNTFFEVSDIGGYASTNNITIDFGSSTFQGVANDDLIIDTNYASVGLWYVNSTWRIF